MSSLRRTLASRTPADKPCASANSLRHAPLVGCIVLNLLHRLDTRLHLIYQRGLHNLLLLACSPPLLPPCTSPDQTNLVPQTDTPTVP